VRGDDETAQAIANEGSPGWLFSNRRRALRLAFPEKGAFRAQRDCGEFEVPVDFAKIRCRNFKFKSTLLEFNVCRSSFDSKFASEVATIVYELRKVGTAA